MLRTTHRKASVALPCGGSGRDRRRLRASLFRAHGAPENGLDLVKESRVAHGAAIHAGKLEILGLRAPKGLAEKVAKGGRPGEPRPHIDKFVVPAGQMRRDAAVRPVLRPLDQPCADGVEGESAKGVDQMIFVHRATGETPLEQMPGHPGAGVEKRRVAPVRLAHGP